MGKGAVVAAGAVVVEDVCRRCGGREPRPRYQDAPTRRPTSKPGTEEAASPSAAFHQMPELLDAATSVPSFYERRIRSTRLTPLKRAPRSIVVRVPKYASLLFTSPCSPRGVFATYAQSATQFSSKQKGRSPIGVSAFVFGSVRPESTRPAALLPSSQSIAAVGPSRPHPRRPSLGGPEPHVEGHAALAYHGAEEHVHGPRHREPQLVEDGDRLPLDLRVDPDGGRGHVRRHGDSSCLPALTPPFYRTMPPARPSSPYRAAGR